MSASLVTGGLLAPHGATGGSSGPADVICAFMLRDADGVPTAGVDLSTATKRVSQDGGVTWAGAAGATPISREDGFYTYTFDSSETGVDYVWFKLEMTGYQLVVERVDIVDPNITAAVIDIENSVNAGFGVVEGDIISLGTTINAHTDTKATAINAHTDSALAATEASIETAITNSETATATLVNAHADATAADIEAAIAAVQAGVDSLPDDVWDKNLLGAYTVRQWLIGMFAVQLGDALGLKTSSMTFEGPDGEIRVTASVNANGDRVVVLNLPP